MRLLCISIGIIFAFSVCRLEAGWLKQQMGLEYDFSERAVIEFSPEERNYWKQAYSHASPEGNSIVEWIPRLETLDNYTQMLTFQFFANNQDESVGGAIKKLLFSPRPFDSQTPRESANSFINKLCSKMKANNPDMIWNTISLSENDVVFEWILPKGIPGKQIHYLHVIGRVLTTQKGRHHITYERSIAFDEVERALWIDRIRNAPLRTNK